MFARESGKKTKIPRSTTKSLPSMRASAWVLPEVSPLPVVLAKPCAQRRNSWVDQSQLVMG
jgi:hypothetical protein